MVLEQKPKLPKLIAGLLLQEGFLEQYQIILQPSCADCRTSVAVVVLNNLLRLRLELSRALLVAVLSWILTTGFTNGKPSLPLNHGHNVLCISSHNVAATACKALATVLSVLLAASGHPARAVGQPSTNCQSSTTLNWALHWASGHGAVLDGSSALDEDNWLGPEGTTG